LKKGEKMTTPFSDRDFSDLDGKRILFWDELEWIPSIVAGIDYNAGITVMYAGDRNKYALCLIGEAAKGKAPEAWSEPSTRKHYDTLFFSIVAQIRKGRVSHAMNHKLVSTMKGKFIGRPSADTCPFT
jgi:hypothetical protein